MVFARPWGDPEDGGYAPRGVEGLRPLPVLAEGKGMEETSGVTALALLKVGCYTPARRYFPPTCQDSCRLSTVGVSQVQAFKALY